MERTSVLILFGGMAEEHDISVKSAKELYRALDTRKYRPICVYITREGEWRRVTSPEADLRGGERALFSADRSAPGLFVFVGERVERAPADVVFPMLHGRFGEDGAIQGLLELSGIPYVGCGVAASALGMDKSLAYMAALRAGVRVPKHWTIYGCEVVSGGEWRYPVFVKPARSGSSFGVSKVYMESALNDAVRDARKYDDKVLIEEAVIGDEVGCAVMGYGGALITGEIDKIELSGGFFRIHQERAPEKGSANAVIRVPAALTEHMRARVSETAKAVYRALGCQGLARVDMYLTNDGEVVLGEVNTMPGFTSYSRYPRMLRAAGILLERAIDDLINMALINHARKGA